jgi:hypothetical protein
MDWVERDVNKKLGKAGAWKMPLNRELDLLCGAIAGWKITFPCYLWSKEFTHALDLCLTFPNHYFNKKFNLERAQHAELPPLKYDNNFAEGSHMVDDLCDAQGEQGVPVAFVCRSSAMPLQYWPVPFATIRGSSVYHFTLSIELVEYCSCIIIDQQNTIPHESPGRKQPP